MLKSFISIAQLSGDFKKTERTRIFDKMNRTRSAGFLTAEEERVENGRKIGYTFNSAVMMGGVCYVLFEYGYPDNSI